MIHISSNDVKKLEYIGSGNFGTVYKKDATTAYKIYHPTVYDNNVGISFTNPTLTLSKLHYKLLLSRSKKLNYSGGINDLIYVDGSFGGVCIPYYEGTTLDKLINKPLKLKIDMAKQLVRNSKELNDHLIFPTDYKLNNILLSNENIKIIDLDDKRTHASLTPNPLFKTWCINALWETINIFFKDYEHLSVPKDIINELDRSKYFNYCFSYIKIEDYLEKKEKEKNIVFVDKIDEVDKLKELYNNGLNIVCILKKNLEKKKYLEIINYCKINNIKLFDFILIDKIDNYSNIENINESYFLSNKELKKVYKKC